MQHGSGHIVSLFAGLVLVGCAEVPLKPLRIPAERNSGTVIVFRESAFAAGGVTLTVGLKDAAFALLRNSEKVTARLAVGEHEFFVQARSAEATRLRAHVKAGGVLCLRTSSSPSTYAKTLLPPLLMITGYHFYLDEVTCPGREELNKYVEVIPAYEASSGGR